MPTAYDLTDPTNTSESVLLPNDGDPANETILAQNQRVLSDRIATLLYLRAARDWRREVNTGSYTGSWTCATYGAWNATEFGWMVAGQTQQVQRSQDGTTWEVVTPAGGYTGYFYGVAAHRGDAGGIVLVGESGEIQRSATLGGSLAQETAGSSFSGNFAKVRHLGAQAGSNTLGDFFAVGASGEVQQRVGSSTWTRRRTGGGDLKDIAYNGTLTTGGVYNGTIFVAVGAGGRIITAADPTDTWVERTADNSFTDAFYCVIWTGTNFVAFGEGHEIQTSPDGITWTHRYGNDTGSWDQFLFDAVFFRGHVLAYGSTGGYNGSQMSGPEMLQSRDHGVTWERITGEIGSDGASDQVNAIATDYRGDTGRSSRILAAGDTGYLWKSAYGGDVPEP